ncbi:origin recognition complex subunit 3 N-terminus-domain-containing protein [Zychaea mexicana]|uniref:origin recognition complex subunit 3 N-terminus-domain-containing protein n=1 Tax=Zychaea mexicana TaxID=64656 RepID=UPI0022FDE113|nr:origin recognition complex subunit 3 N-terminus-domain-containing protein [Zychaea mexicana]KAI9485059.1 origin recognition complex subunit 3 N-terminus-domain-containing protein [Zychaea mexicana]
MAAITSGRDDFDSISEGCFLILPQTQRAGTQSKSTAGQKRKRTTRKIQGKVARRHVDEQHHVPYQGFEQLFGNEESTACMKMRRIAFEEAWTQTQTIINDILLDMNRAALNKIASFVETSPNSASQGLVHLPFHEIPTGLVFAGINTPDHNAQFKQIANKLSENNSNFVALLQSKDCNNLKNMMKTMIEQFLSIDAEPSGKEKEDRQETEHDDEISEQEEDDVDEDEHEGTTLSSALLTGTTAQSGNSTFEISSGGGGTRMKKRASKLPPYDMQILEAWYRHVTNVKKSNHPPPNLVVVLQDLESFEANMLRDFITICSEYRLKIPIVFIMGIATSTEILHQSLTKATIGLLRIEKFWLEQSDVWFNRMLEAVFIESVHTLKFGARPYKFLLDHFYLYDFSMGRATASLKYALMHHYYGNPLSIFSPLVGRSEDDIRSTLKEWHDAKLLNEHHITSLRMLSSFRAHVDAIADQDPQQALRLLDDDNDASYLMTEALAEFILGLKRYQHEFQYGIELIRALQGQFSNNVGMRKSKRMLLLAALESRDGLTSSEMILWPASLVRKLDPAGLDQLVKRISPVVEQFGYALPCDWNERLQMLLGADAAYQQKVAKKLAGMVLPDEERRSTETAKKVQMESMDHLKQAGTDKTKIAIEIADWISETLKGCLRSYTTVPMYELVYYTSAKLHEKSFSAQPRAAMQTGLGQSYHYLNCACCSGKTKHQISPSEHDTCILYKLYLECGRMINLFDWFVAFGYVLEREKRSNNKSKSLSEKEVQARFVRSVAELQFLGFIKPTQRKTDHVQRLTWSNV